MQQETLDSKHDSKRMQLSNTVQNVQQGIITLPTYSRSALQASLRRHAWVLQIQEVGCWLSTGEK